ncbi:MAG: hypothetical protein COV48_07065 [Elusimicrobia bacterium CG11_big_fil_rev_8_21_14_0_20_64_6]|nr:MAG: hypothetical protein COV48_07065 [Elusimicrobia bacterium CG11_big_fil_rev_8_21_14_0_20_64_6]
MKIALALSLLLPVFSGAARAASAAADVKFQKVESLIEMGEYEGARAELESMCSALKKDDPRQVRCFERSGALWLREDMIAEAQVAFTQALETAHRLIIEDEHVGKAYVGMGLCLRRGKNDKYAHRFFKKAFTYHLDAGTRMFVEDQIREIEGKPPIPAR